MEYLGTEKPVNGIEPLVSVCVITYNHGKYIRQCLDSILMQETTFRYEVIVGEDDSRDETRSICIEYAGKYPEKIRLFLRSRRDVIHIEGKPTGRFNFMENIKACRGKYITVCEGDDYWTDPMKLQKQADRLGRDPDKSLCFHDFLVIDSENRIAQRQNMKDVAKKDRTPFELARGCSMHMNTVMFRNLIREFPAEFTKVVNGDKFLLAYLGQFGGAAYVKEVAASHYRVHGGGIWSSSQRKLESPLNTFSLLRHVMPDKYHPVINYRIFRTKFKIWRALTKNGRYLDSLKALADTILFMIRYGVFRKPENY